MTMFNERLKELRAAKKITQEALAKDINVSKGAVAMWETGKRTPDLDMLKTIAAYFGTSVDDLIGAEKVPSKSNEIDEAYFSLAKRAQSEGIAPEDIELAINTIKALRSKNKGE